LRDDPAGKPGRSGGRWRRIVFANLSVPVPS
jgi:hypothetical protein